MPTSGSGAPSVGRSLPNACHPVAFHLPGFTDEHGYGGYCHNWESEHHQPWCYVDDKCEGGRRGVKMRKHQACSSPLRRRLARRPRLWLLVASPQQ